MKEKINATGWTTGRIIIASATLIVVFLILSATAIIYGVSSTVGTAIRSNPDLLSAAWLGNSASEQPEIMTLFLSKYLKDLKGGFDGNGQIDGSFTGRFTTRQKRSLEKINLSCVDQYNYQIVTTPSFPVGVFAANTLINERRFTDNDCQVIGKFSEPDTIGDAGLVVISNKSYEVYRCPLHNCQMREITREFAGDFIPESINVRRVQAGVSSQVGK